MGIGMLSKKAIVARVMEKLATPRPPKSWVKEVTDSIKQKNPGISNDSAGKIMGNMWFNEMDEASRSKVKKEHKD